MDGAWLWFTFVLIGLASTGPRASFILPGQRARLPGGLQRALRYAPAAALAALVMPELLVDAGALQPFNPRLAAGLAVAAVALRWRNPWLPFIAGMGVLLVLRKGFGL